MNENKRRLRKRRRKGWRKRRTRKRQKKEKKKPAPEEEAEKKEKKKKEEVEKKEKKKQEEAEKKEKKKQEEAEKKLKKEEGKNTKKLAEKKTKDETKKKKESKKKGTEKEEHLEEVSSDDDIMLIKTKKPAKEANNDDSNDENFVVLVELIQRYGRDPLFNLLSQDTILTFQATQPYKDDGWPDMGKLIGAAYNNKITEIQEYYLSGKGFKKFEKFCKSKYLDAELKCLVAFERLMEKADNYVEFMILYREIWITYLQSGGVNLDGIDILRAVFDACWEDQEKEPKPLSLVDVTSVPKNLKM